MIVFLYGSDSYRSRQKLNEIIEENKKVHKNSLNLRVFDCQVADFFDFKNELETISMFDDKKLVILKNIFSNSQFGESFLVYKKKLLTDKKNIIVAYQDQEPDKRKVLYKFLKENAKCQEFESLEGQQLLNWAKKELEKLNAKIEPNALEELIISVGPDLWRLSNEINKLANFKKGQTITQKDVNNLVQSESETNIFKTIEAIARKNRKQALILLHEHLEKGEQPLYLLTMINYQFRNILMLKDLLEKRVQYSLLAKKTGLHPFVISKTYHICQNFSLPQLKKIYRKIFQIDLDIKTGKIWPETALDLFISGL